MTIPDVLGWVPAVIFPIATLSQLIPILRTKSVEGISVMAWLLFGTGNLSLYIFIGKYSDPRLVLALLTTSLLNFLIVAAVCFHRRRAFPGDKIIKS